MKVIPFAFFLLVSLLVAGCSTMKIRKDVVGTYVAKNGDFIVIRANGFVGWSPLSKSLDDLVAVGYLSLREKENVGLFYGPDTSPYISTRFNFSDDYTKINVVWVSYREDTGNRAIDYELNR